MFTMFFLVKLTIAIVIVCGILSPILVSPLDWPPESPDNQYHLNK